MKDPKLYVVDDRTNTTDCGNIFTYLVYTFTIIKFPILVYQLCFFYQTLMTIVSYFSNGTTDCRLTYDLGFHVWLFAFSAFFNIIDIIFSFQTGMKLWGYSVPIFNGISGVANVGVLIGLLIYTLECNMSGVNTFMNICTDFRSCGTTTFLVNATNNCQFYNPTLLPLYPPITTNDLTWDWVYIQFFTITIVYIILDAGKFTFNILIPKNLDVIKDSASKIIQLAKDLKEDGASSLVTTLFETLKSQKKYVKEFEKDGKLVITIYYTKSQFFDFFKLKHKIIYAIGVIGIYFVFYLPLYLWFQVWIMQHTRSSIDTYILDPDHVDYSKIVSNINYEHFMLYLFISLNIIPITFNLYIGNFFDNIISLISSGFGIIINVVVFMWLNFVYLIVYNKNGYPNNIATFKRYKCQDPITYPNNGCTNTYSCPVLKPFPPGLSGIDFDFIIIYIFTFIALVYNIFIFIFGFVLRKKFNKMNVK